MILRKAKEDAEFRLGEPVTHAVITVPAYFSQIQRDATRKAGLKIMKIIDEPTAAAIAFGIEARSEEPRILLVYDLGGGTFDVSLLMLAGNVYAPLNLEGDMWLGGDDLDQAIINHALGWIAKEYAIDPSSEHRFMVALRQAAQRVKERLSGASSADLVVSGMLRDSGGNLLDIEMEITRAQFERMIAPLIGHYRVCSANRCATVNLLEDSRCIKCGQALSGDGHRGKSLQIVDASLKNQNLTRKDIDYVLMAGNSTMVPFVLRTMEKEFGAEKVKHIGNPKHQVAMGAAIAAAWLKFNLVCQAPDPSDPKQECGHVNAPDATACQKCGGVLSPIESSSSGPESPGAEDGPDWGVGEIGGIAPFNYGTQTAGDQYNVFIHKGDPFPTENPKQQTFSTRVPNQRIVSIPVYGGDNLTKASANEKQGRAFALLPPNLPAETPIKIQLKLDNNGIFEIEAWLEDATSLRPWNVKGEEDAKIIENIDQLNQRLGEQTDKVSPKTVAAVELARDRVFDSLREREFTQAERHVDEARRILDEAGQEGDLEELENRADNLVAYGEFILHQYDWAMADRKQIYSLTKAIEETKDALKSGKTVIVEKTVKVLEDALDKLPETVQSLMAMKSAILARIQPSDPVLAANLMKELNEIEAGARKGDVRVMQKIGDFIAKLTQAIADMESRRPSTHIVCSNGHRVSSGQRHCPTCSEDTWMLKGQGATSGRFTH
ncbi:MAG: Hsp70 family protein [Methylococcales bacterium]